MFFKWESPIIAYKTKKIVDEEKKFAFLSGICVGLVFVWIIQIINLRLLLG